MKNQLPPFNPNVKLTKAQQRATYTFPGKFQNGKPVFQIPPGNVINLESAFGHKLLCDGPTFTLGLLCHFSCSFCYVEPLLSRHPAIIRIRKEYGLQAQDIAVEKHDPLPILKKQLVTAKGERRFPDPNDRRVIFSSPLVDCAANMLTAPGTVAACRLILAHTNWQIRLLSKSALLKLVAEQLVEFKSRIIYGFSTGTFDDKLAVSFEQHTSSPTARLRSLHWLQDNGFRTFAMVCPSLPQRDYDQFAALAAAKVRAHLCEDYWAEVLNVRGQSLKRTHEALIKGGFKEDAERLLNVSGPKHRAAWEEYARQTFLAHAAVIPPEKLKFMQYVNPQSVGWWRGQQNRGAVLLGKHAEPVVAPLTAMAAPLAL
jgi:DNA repair photolyase